jgi:hypothetical protein
MRSVTRVHFDSLVGTFRWQVLMLESRGRQEPGGQHVRVERTIIGVHGRCRNRAGEVNTVKPRGSRYGKWQNESRSDGIQQLQHARAGVFLGFCQTISCSRVLDATAQDLMHRPCFGLLFHVCCTVYKCRAVPRRSSAECYG